MNTIRIHIERLATALASKGLRLKRHNLLEVVAAAFGYHNHNEAKAAADRGDLKAPMAERVGRIAADGQELVVLRDVRADALYAVAASKVTAGGVGITPYGNLVGIPERDDAEDVAELAEEDIVHIARISHKNGVAVMAGHTRADVSRQVAEHARGNWAEALEATRCADTSDRLDLPEDDQVLTDDQVEDLYFRAVSIDDPANYVEYDRLRMRPRTRKTRDPRYRSYPSTSHPNEPVEADYHSAHDTPGEAIACSKANRRGGFDSYVVDHVGRRFWRASKNWVEEAFAS